MAYVFSLMLKAGLFLPLFIISKSYFVINSNIVGTAPTTVIVETPPDHRCSLASRAAVMHFSLQLMMFLILLVGSDGQQ